MLLGQIVIYHDIRAIDPKFELCFHSIFFLKNPMCLSTLKNPTGVQVFKINGNLSIKTD